jgi:hypothetical protein
LLRNIAKSFSRNDVRQSHPEPSRVMTRPAGLRH